jgi:hypothetical protein
VSDRVLDAADGILNVALYLVGLAIDDGAVLPRNLPSSSKCITSSNGGFAFVVCLSAQSAFEQSSQFLAGAADSLLQGCPFVADCDRLTAGRSSLHKAAFVDAARFAGVLVAEMDFDPGDLIAELAQSGVDLGLDLTGKIFAAFDVGICIHLDLHEYSPW